MSVEERVIEIVSEQMGVSKDQVTRETSFVNDLGADSLDTVELVMEFEEEFDITIPDEEAEKIQTVGQAIDYIESMGTPSDRARFLTEDGKKRRLPAACRTTTVLKPSARSWHIRAASLSPAWG